MYGVSQGGIVFNTPMSYQHIYSQPTEFGNGGLHI